MFQTDITKMLADFKVPGVDFEPMNAAQRKNIEAQTEANQHVIAGIQVVMKRQAEIFQALMEEARTVANEIMVLGAPEAKAVNVISKRVTRRTGRDQGGSGQGREKASHFPVSTLRPMHPDIRKHGSQAATSL